MMVSRISMIQATRFLPDQTSASRGQMVDTVTDRTQGVQQNHMAMENTLFTADFPSGTPISIGFPIATFEYRKVYGLQSGEFNDRYPYQSWGM